METFIPDYVNALCDEIRRAGMIVKKDEFIHTIYFGGGTPSVLSGKDYVRIIAASRKYFQLTLEPEISMEVNPGTATPEFLKEIFKLGVNRLSIGMQSSKPEELRILGRIHGPVDVINTVKWARQAGFSNISLDLMFGLPGQTIKSWQNSIEFALQLKPTHLSLYSLTIEEKTLFAKWRSKGLLSEMDEDFPADLYEIAMASLGKSGFIHYEISNWVKKSNEETSNICRHNMQYWLDQPYLGIGAGAHSYYNHQRWENIGTIDGYIQAKERKDYRKVLFAQINLQELDKKTEMQETMFMGLRLVQQGVSNSEFQTRFGKLILDVFSKEVNELIKIGLVEWVNGDNGFLRLTQRGILVGNQVFMRFVD